MRRAIDTSFDFRTDAFGNDPDAYSATLRRYHKLLWSKPLPSGALFDLDDTTYRVYLHHLSNLGEFVLSSDTVIPTFARHIAMKPTIAQFSEAENEEFGTIRYTIGGMILWPGNQIDRKMTINGARGLKPGDRRPDGPDPRVHPPALPGCRSPLGDVLARYSDFFALFGDFRGYVDFFLLQDLVTDDYSAVRCFMPFDDFSPRHCRRTSPPTRSTGACPSSSSEPETAASTTWRSAQHQHPLSRKRPRSPSKVTTSNLTGRPPSTAATSTGRFISSQVPSTGRSSPAVW